MRHPRPKTRNARGAVTSRLRLREWNYHTPGYYFVTICTFHRQHILGNIRTGTMIPSPLGESVLDVWSDLPARFPDVTFEPLCLMPNHVHFLIGIGLDCLNDEFAESGLIDVVNAFKSFTGRRYRETGNGADLPPLWQKGYHDHIVRDDRDLNRIRDYMLRNPETWEQDGFWW